MVQQDYRWLKAMKDDEERLNKKRKIEEPVVSTNQQGGSHIKKAEQAALAPTQHRNKVQT